MVVKRVEDGAAELLVLDRRQRRPLQSGVKAEPCDVLQRVGGARGGVAERLRRPGLAVASLGAHVVVLAVVVAPAEAALEVAVEDDALLLEREVLGEERHAGGGSVAAGRRGGGGHVGDDDVAVASDELDEHRGRGDERGVGHRRALRLRLRLRLQRAAVLSFLAAHRGPCWAPWLDR